MNLPRIVTDDRITLLRRLERLEAQVSRLLTQSKRTTPRRPPCRKTLNLMAPVIERVCAETGFSPADLRSESRAAPLCAARFVVMFEARELGVSFSEIGAALNRDHSTVMSGFAREKARRGMLLLSDPTNNKGRSIVE